MKVVSSDKDVDLVALCVNILINIHSEDRFRHVYKQRGVDALLRVSSFP